MLVVTKGDSVWAGTLLAEMVLFPLIKGKSSIRRIQRYNRPYTLKSVKNTILVFVLISEALGLGFVTYWISGRLT